MSPSVVSPEKQRTDGTHISWILCCTSMPYGVSCVDASGTSSTSGKEQEKE